LSWTIVRLCARASSLNSSYEAVRQSHCIILLAAGALCSWLYCYTGDLPSIAGLDQYSPAAAAVIQDQGNSLTHVVPTDQLGKFLVSAVIAAEGQAEPRGPIHATVSDLLLGAQPHAQMYSWRLARELAPRGHALRRQIDELRLAEQIQRHFDQRQVMTIYLNRVYLGEKTYGVEDGSLRYFGKTCPICRSKSRLSSLA
jgi:penicillin-binding protein 1A